MVAFTSEEFSLLTHAPGKKGTGLGEAAEVPPTLSQFPLKQSFQRLLPPGPAVLPRQWHHPCEGVIGIPLIWAMSPFSQPGTDTTSHYRTLVLGTLVGPGRTHDTSRANRVSLLDICNWDWNCPVYLGGYLERGNVKISKPNLHLEYWRVEKAKQFSQLKYKTQRRWKWYSSLISAPCWGPMLLCPKAP